MWLVWHCVLHEIVHSCWTPEALQKMKINTQLVSSISERLTLLYTLYSISKQNFFRHVKAQEHFFFFYDCFSGHHFLKNSSSCKLSEVRNCLCKYKHMVQSNTGIVHPNMRILSSSTHLYVTPKPFFPAEHTRRSFKKCW